MEATELLALSILIPVGIYSIRARSSFKLLPVMGIFLLTCLVSDSIITYLSRAVKNNHLQTTLYFIAQSTLIPTMMIRRFNKVSYIIINILLICTTVICGIQALSGWYSSDVTTGYWAMACIIVVFSSGSYFIHEVQHNFSDRLWKNGWFYICSAFYIYYSTSTIFYMTLLEVPERLFSGLWNVKMVAYAIHNLFISLGIYQITSDQ